MIEMSVIFPLYRAAPIGWLGLESLCNQHDIDFKWELIVAEEANPLPLGVDSILLNASRLKNVGCITLKYISLPHWIPLSMKYKVMSEACSDSKVFFTQGADYWSPKFRMKKTLSLFNFDVDWVHGKNMMMYDLASGKVFNRTKNPIKFWMALRMDLARQLPLSKKKKGCDQYLIDSCVSNKKGPLNKLCCTDWGTGIVVHGLNNLTSNFDKFRAEEIDKKITDILPEHIVHKLHQTFSPSWEIKIPKHNIPTTIPEYHTEIYNL